MAAARVVLVIVVAVVVVVVVVVVIVGVVVVVIVNETAVAVVEIGVARVIPEIEKLKMRRSTRIPVLNLTILAVAQRRRNRATKTTEKKRHTTTMTTFLERSGGENGEANDWIRSFNFYLHITILPYVYFLL